VRAILSRCSNFSPTNRSVEWTSGGTTIATLDMSRTATGKIVVGEMVSLVGLVLPRRCVPRPFECAVPSLCDLRAFRSANNSARHSTEVRFERLAAHAELSPAPLEARVCGELACEMGRATLPFPPQ
jgi:hypothetical protein